MTECQDGTLIAMEVMGCQMHAIRKAINPFSQIRSHINKTNPTGNLQDIIAKKSFMYSI